MKDPGTADRIVLIGPTLPYRGGIAQHTTMLFRALKLQCQCTALSFSRQYPGWLFPGESDQDPAYAGYREPEVKYVIDSVNPLTWRAASKRARGLNPDLVIIPWWTVYWAPCLGYLARSLARADIPVVFFCHNVIEHESAHWKRFLTRRVLQIGEQFVVHTHADEENLLREFPNARVTVHPHPIADQFPTPQGNLERRAELELLFFGFVRPYKGLDVLVEALGLVGDLDYRLTIAGEFWHGSAEIESRIRELNITSRIEVIPRFISESETAELFARADVVVLPYRSATGSGIVPIAYHYEKPVLVTNVGGLSEVVHHEETGWVVPPERPDAIADVIRAITREDAAAMAPAIDRLKNALSWPSLGRAVLGTLR